MRVIFSVELFEFVFQSQWTRDASCCIPHLVGGAARQDASRSEQSDRQQLAAVAAELQIDWMSDCANCSICALLVIATFVMIETENPSSRNSPLNAEYEPVWPSCDTYGCPTALWSIQPMA